MKRSRLLFSFLFVLSLFVSLTLVSSCDESTDDQEKVIENATLILSDDKKEIRLPKEGGTETISFTTNNTWEVESDSRWCEVSPSSGSSEAASFTITVSKNDSDGERSAKIIISSSPLTDTITLIQSGGQKQDNYTDIDWDKTTISSYDESSGGISMTFTGDAPKLQKKNAIVLPRGNNYAIRVIKDYSISGNTLTATTTEGNMTNLFSNIDFTLSSDPSLSPFTRSYAQSSNIITPSEIGVMTQNGYEVIYTNLGTKSDYTSFDIFSYNKTHSGEDIYTTNYQRLYWKTFVFDIGLKGLFNFKFGEEIETALDIVSSFEKFSFFLDGHVNVDLLLEYIAQAGISVDKDEKIKGVNIKDVHFKWVVGVVPIWIVVRTDLYRSIEANANAEITISAGSKMTFNTRMGMEYTKGVGTVPIKSVEPRFEIYQPTFTAKGSASAKVSLYPKIQFDIYSSLGPWVAPMPYPKANIAAGMQSGDNSYFGWNAGVNAGFDLKMGLELSVFGLGSWEAWNSEVYNMVDVSILECPNKIELLSPDANGEVEQGQAVEVRFKVFNYSALLNKYFSSIGAVVQFRVEHGDDVDREFSVADRDGLVSVTWTPQKTDPRLTARVVDKDGNAISEVTYAPEIKEGELLVITHDATNIQETIATFKGEVKAKVSTTVTERGFVYSTTDHSPTVDGEFKVVSGSGEGVFSSDVTDLTPETEHYVRAYAINSTGTSYGNTKTFTTTSDISVSVAVSLGGFTVYDRNAGSSQDSVAYNYTNDTYHEDHKNSGFKGGYYTWEQAKSACSGGRLPSKEELQVISNAMRFSEGRAYIADGDGNRCYFPLSGELYDRPSRVEGNYWSSTGAEYYDGDYYYAWTLYVNTSNSSVNNNYATNFTSGLFVRCVR